MKAAESSILQLLPGKYETDPHFGPVIAGLNDVCLFDAKRRKRIETLLLSSRPFYWRLLYKVRLCEPTKARRAILKLADDIPTRRRFCSAKALERLVSHPWTHKAEM